MIRARIAANAAVQAQRLARRAALLARARAENALREARADPWRWRKARLLWPLFTKD